MGKEMTVTLFVSKKVPEIIKHYLSNRNIDYYRESSYVNKKEFLYETYSDAIKSSIISRSLFTNPSVTLTVLCPKKTGFILAFHNI